MPIDIEGVKPSTTILKSVVKIKLSNPSFMISEIAVSSAFGSPICT